MAASNSRSKGPQSRKVLSTPVHRGRNHNNVTAVGQEFFGLLHAPAGMQDLLAKSPLPPLQSDSAYVTHRTDMFVR